ncbi:MAG: hypothetical protein L3J79_07300 [Candidatus Marinimicrobia bacterium]|nr:hypothetical protein [Candidatus Neomarinimicrobiota bacterium]
MLKLIIFVLLMLFGITSCSYLFVNGETEAAQVATFTEAIALDGVLFKYQGGIDVVSTEHHEIIVLFREKIEDYDGYMHLVLQVEEEAFPVTLPSSINKAQIEVYKDRCILSNPLDGSSWLIGTPEGLEKIINEHGSLLEGYGFIVQSIPNPPDIPNLSEIHSMFDIIAIPEQNDVIAEDDPPQLPPCTTVSCSYSSGGNGCSVTCAPGYTVECGTLGCYCRKCKDPTTGGGGSGE